MPTERQWPTTTLAQETLRLATELAQDAWLVDELGPDGEPVLGQIVAGLRAIHRASLRGGERQDLHFVLQYVASSHPQFVHVTHIREKGMRGEPRARTDADAEKGLQQITSLFLAAYERSFGQAKCPANVRGALEALWREWPNTGGRAGYVTALHALWIALKGKSLDMSSAAIHKFASEYRTAGRRAPPDPSHH